MTTTTDGWSPRSPTDVGGHVFDASLSNLVEVDEDAAETELIIAEA
jgi:hypothetical protein